MKKIIAIVTALLLLTSLAVSAMATETPAEGFTPSITYKPMPEIIPVVDEEGNEYTGEVKDEEGNVVGYLDEGCLLVTPIAHVWDPEVPVPQEVEELLTTVYEELGTGEMELPYNLFATVEGAPELNPDDMVIRDLFDARWGCQEHHDMVEPDGVVLELTFDVGIAPDTKMYVMSYDEAADKWEPVVNTINNGDGTVTCIFEHLCAIAFTMPLVAAEEPAAPAASNSMIWLVLLAVAAVAVVGVLVMKNKKSAAAK